MTKAQHAPPPRFDLDARCRAFPFLGALKERVLIFDGAMGTMIQRANLTADDFGGAALEGCNEYLCFTRPDVIARIHAAYFEAGCDIVETNTFGSSSIVLAEYDIAKDAFALSKAAAAIARKVADDYSQPGRPRFVAGSLGPTTKLVSLGHITFAEQRRSFAEQIHGMLEGGIDVVQIETSQDLLQTRAAILAARDAFRLAGREVPIIAQVTIETTGTMLVGSDLAAALPVLESLEVDVVGLNCALGPDLMTDHVRFLGKNASRFVSVLPNAGLPRNVGGVATYDLTPELFAEAGRRFVSELGVSTVGGCCGTTPEHIAALVKELDGHPAPKRPTRSDWQGTVTSLYGPVTLQQQPPPLIVGERTNANGSKKFRELLLAEDWDAMARMSSTSAPRTSAATRSATCARCCAGLRRKPRSRS
jgi:5-methyltetrahydrofolate--homocysteine methyltransferase